MPQATQWPANEGRPWSSRVEQRCPKVWWETNISKICKTEHTPRKINMEPDKLTRHPWKRKNHLPNHHFQVLCESSEVYPNFELLQQSIWYILVHFPTTERILKKHTFQQWPVVEEKTMDLDKGNRMKLSWTPLIRHCSQRKRRPLVFLLTL